MGDDGISGADGVVLAGFGIDGSGEVATFSGGGVVTDSFNSSDSIFGIVEDDSVDLGISTCGLGQNLIIRRGFTVIAMSERSGDEGSDVL